MRGLSQHFWKSHRRTKLRATDALSTLAYFNESTSPAPVPADTHGYVIVSKDSDFQQRSLLFGPPQFIWVRLGNCSVAESADLLRTPSVVIHTFAGDASQSHLMLP